MKEATGEVSMTVVTLVAIAVIGAIIAAMWPKISEKITGLWGSDSKVCETWDTKTGKCTKYKK